ncbi:MAG: anti-sigma factor [Chloroflexi bacterium]|nr:anti-sigma factor [Chloroflexota bacterium]
MNAKLTYDQVLELLPAYVLGALEPEEMLAVDAYIQNNWLLLERLHQAELAAAQMAHAAPDAPLPTDTKEKLLARVHADLATPAAVEPGVNVAPQPAELTRPAARKSAPAPNLSGGWWTGLQLVFRSGKLWAVATGCAVVALLGVIFYLNQTQAQLRQVTAQLDTLGNKVSQLQQTNQNLQQQLLASQGQMDQASADLNTLKTQVAQLQAANTQLQQANATLQQQTQTDQELLALIATVNPERTVQLPGTEEAPAASGTFYLGDDNQGLLVLSGLKPLPAEQTYELWLIPPEGQPEPAGLLAVKTDSPTWLTVSVPPEAQNFAAVGVSVEPAGGSPAPTGPIVLLSKTG